MKGIFNYFKNYKVNTNQKPYKKVVLPTGIICEHYLNGKIKIK